MQENRNGIFTVVNAMEDDIMYVSVTHQCGENKDDVQSTLMNSGYSIAAGLNSDDSNDDLWSVSFKRKSNEYKATNKKANYKDIDKGLGVVVILYYESFSIIFPKSENVLRIPYDA